MEIEAAGVIVGEEVAEEVIMVARRKFGKRRTDEYVVTVCNQFRRKLVERLKEH